jgi:lycopene beta-cyclase
MGPWKPNYCLWADELPDELASVVEHRWAGATVSTPFGAAALDRSYVKLDTAKLQAMWWTRLWENHVDVASAIATEIDHTDYETHIATAHGMRYTARVVIDASGATSPFVQRVHQRPPAFQTAFGLLLEAPSHPFDRDRAVLMDFRVPAGVDSDPASFAYVLPLDDGRLFVEETVLASRPAVPIDLLAARLETRLRAHGLDGCTRLEEERCRIAMGVGLPTRHQALVPFGAAASMVHPASGYLQAHIFRKAPRVAEAIVDGLQDGGARVAIDAGNQALWPSSERSAWELYTVGLEALVRMENDGTAAFFDAFFRLPTDSWAGFLGGTLAPVPLLAVMTQLFRVLPSPLRRSLVGSSVTWGAAPLARSLVRAGA